MNTTYDKIADALYIRFKRGKVAKTVKVKDRLIVDTDNNGNILGIEVLEASAQVSKKIIQNFLTKKVLA